MTSTRRVIMTKSRRTILKTMTTRTEWDALSLSRVSGIAYATVYQSLAAFEDYSWVTLRVESRHEHRNRSKTPGTQNKGPKLTLWRLTTVGQQAARDL
jgi:Fe2+ or Zn2+ uptake regulation protein